MPSETPSSSPTPPAVSALSSSTVKKKTKKLQLRSFGGVLAGVVGVGGSSGNPNNGTGSKGHGKHRSLESCALTATTTASTATRGMDTRRLLVDRTADPRAATVVSADAPTPRRLAPPHRDSTKKARAVGVTIRHSAHQTHNAVAMDPPEGSGGNGNDGVQDDKGDTARLPHRHARSGGGGGGETATMVTTSSAGAMASSSPYGSGMLPLPTPPPDLIQHVSPLASSCCPGPSSLDESQNRQAVNVQALLKHDNGDEDKEKCHGDETQGDNALSLFPAHQNPTNAQATPLRQTGGRPHGSKHKEGEIDPGTTSKDVGEPSKERIETNTSLPKDPRLAALQRPFGRSTDVATDVTATSTRTTTGQWVVEISAAEWDADESKWKYRILVQKRDIQPQHARTAADPLSLSAPQTPTTKTTSLTAAFTWRTAPEFFWLEQALHDEYHGALLVPVLAVALGHTAESAQVPVAHEKLKHWLSDVLNGVRGANEWHLTSSTGNHHNNAKRSRPTSKQRTVVNEDAWDVMASSRSLETFLYRNSVQSDEQTPTPPLHRHPPPESACVDETGETSMLKALLLTVSVPLELCGVHQGCDDEASSMQKQSNASSHVISYNQCSSRAVIADLSMVDGDSIVESTASSYHMNSHRRSTWQSQLIFSAAEVALNYKWTALQLTRKMNVLILEEERVGAAWKRLAQSLAGLFQYEKEVEHDKGSNLGDTSKVKREYQPYRKVEDVDEAVRQLSAAKKNRAVPAMMALQSMVQVYVADLSAVEPAMQAYKSAVRNFEDKVSGENTTYVPSIAQNHASALAHERFKKETKRSLHANEDMLCTSLCSMFGASDLRFARMSWGYLKVEARQCALVRTASSTLKAKLDVVSTSSVSKMRKRHSKAEKVDCVSELDLIHKIVNLGQQAAKKTRPVEDASKAIGSSTVIKNELVEIDNDNFSMDRSRATLRDKALDKSRQRIGRWDAPLAMTIMQSVGVDDPNVRVEETTRDLRLVRKFAIGLRSQVDLCNQAVTQLRHAITGRTTTQSSTTNLPRADVGPTEHHLRYRRNDFLAEFLLLLSGTVCEHSNQGPKPSHSARSLLQDRGIDTRDARGWLPTTSTTTSNTDVGGDSTNGATNGELLTLGDWTVQYAKSRDAQVEWLLSNIEGMLNEYNQRIEAIEGFVYMECVGIQLEKYFSEKRAKALSVFEKKTDLAAALNLATKKRMNDLVKDLQMKQEALGPDVSHTRVKESKEFHLESKSLKGALHDLAIRRLRRAREASTERAVAVLSLWAKEEEVNANEELKTVSRAIAALERNVCEHGV